MFERRAVAGLFTMALFSTATPGEARPLPGLRTQVWHTSNCTASDEKSGDQVLGTILLGLLAPLVEGAVKGLGGALANAGRPEETRTSGLATSAFYRAVPEQDATGVKLVRQAECINAAVDADVPPRTPVALSANTIGDAGASFLGEQGYTRAPRLYLESRIIVSPDRSAWKLLPVQGFVGEPLSTRNRGRDLVVTISIVGPAADSETGVLTTRSFALNRVVANQPLSQRVLDGLATGWMPLPAISEDAKARMTGFVQRMADRKILQASIGGNTLTPAQRADAQQKLARLEDLIRADNAYFENVAPVTVKVDVLQTTDGNKALAAIGKFLTDNNKAIADPIVARINPETRRAADEVAAGAEDEARVGAITAVAAWQNGLEDDSKSAAERRVLEIRAQAACRKLEAAGLADIACIGVD